MSFKNSDSVAINNCEGCKCFTCSNVCINCLSCLRNDDENDVEDLFLPECDGYNA